MRLVIQQAKSKERRQNEYATVLQSVEQRVWKIAILEVVVGFTFCKIKRDYRLKYFHCMGHLVISQGVCG